MRRLSALLPVLLLAGPAFAADPQSDDDKAFYALGAGLSRQIMQLAPFTPEEIGFLTSGLADALGNKPLKASPDTMGPKIREIAQARMQKAAAAEKEKGKAALEKAAAEKGAKKTDSGLVYLELTPGKGDQPKATDTVKVNYRGTLTDGTEFDSSYKRNQPATFPLSGVIKCWTEGVQMMKVGGKSKLVCPSDIAYGERGSPPLIKPGATLVFEVELLSIEKPATPPAATPPAEKK
jgi:FKBP-type peptidyl-prolyl cis-trans isomerase FkpA